MMDLSSARALKYELAEALVARRLSSRRATRSDPRPRAVSLGLAPQPGGGYKIAVRVGYQPDLRDPDVAMLLRQVGADADVKVVGEVAALSGTSLLASLLPGQSVSRQNDNGVGTLGCFVSLEQSGSVAILSNNHVLAGTNAGAVGDQILSPGTSCGGASEDCHVATLHSYEELKLSEPNHVDAAVAVLKDSGYSGGNLVSGGALESSVARDDEIDALDVSKIGRTSNLTRGRITAIEVDGVSPFYGTDQYEFLGSIEVVSTVKMPFSEPGDSGSVIYDSATRMGVGLLFAGNGNVTYANRLDVVLQRMGASLII